MAHISQLKRLKLARKARKNRLWKLARKVREIRTLYTQSRGDIIAGDLQTIDRIVSALDDLQTMSRDEWIAIRDEIAADAIAQCQRALDQ